jgi:hypothetical protein
MSSQIVSLKSEILFLNLRECNSELPSLRQIYTRKMTVFKTYAARHLGVYLVMLQTAVIFVTPHFDHHHKTLQAIIPLAVLPKSRSTYFQVTQHAHSARLGCRE